MAYGVYAGTVIEYGAGEKIGHLPVPRNVMEAARRAAEILGTNVPGVLRMAFDGYPRPWTVERLVQFLREIGIYY